MGNNTEVLNAKEEAAHLKAHVEMIRHLARRLKIQAFKVGKDWRFHKDMSRSWSIGQNPKWTGGAV